MSLISAAATIANAGKRISLNLNGGVPGLASLTIDLAIGEPMQHSAWLTIGEEGAIVRTAQTRLRFVATLGGSGPLAGTAVRVPLYLELGSAEARLEGIACGNGSEETQVRIAARPSFAGAWIGEIDMAALADLRERPNVSPAEIVRTPLLRVTGSAHAEASNFDETILAFDMSDIEAGTVRTTATHDPLATLLDGLLGDLELDVTVLGLGIGLPGPIKDAAASLVGSAVPLLDQVIRQVLGALGLSLGEADVRVNGIRCGGAALVG